MATVSNQFNSFIKPDDALSSKTPYSYRPYTGPGFKRFKQTERFMTIGAGRKYVVTYINKTEAAKYSDLVKLIILTAILIFWLGGLYISVILLSQLIGVSPLVLIFSLIITGPLLLILWYVMVIAYPRFMFLIQNFRSQA